MRLPNGYGSVVKLSGKRRNPWAVRKTVGYNSSGVPQYKYIGYTKTKSEGLALLAEYNANPYEIDNRNITVKDIYEKWLEIRADKFSKGYRASLAVAYKKCASVHNLPYQELRTYHMEHCMNGCVPSSRQYVRGLFKHLDSLAFELDVISKQYSTTLSLSAEPPKKEKTIFTPSEIQLLWKNQSEDIVRLVLVLLYTGYRASELVELTTDKVDLEEMILHGGNKTISGKTKVVPIHPRIQPIIRDLYEHSVYGNLSVINGKIITYDTFRKMWIKFARTHDLKHTLHETRHTFRSELDSKGGNRVSIDRLMGHTSSSVGESVYTHKTLDELRKTIELITYT